MKTTDRLSPDRRESLRTFLVSEAEASLAGKRRMRLRTVLLVLAGAVIVTVGAGVGTGAATAINHAPFIWTPSTEPGGRATLAPVPDWPTNESGQSYGAQGNSPIAPDLIGVMATNGVPGYVLATDLAAVDGSSPTTPEEAGEWSKAHNGTYMDIPVYSSDGVTQVGIFRVGDWEGVPFSG
jgi:hypothetical protein